MADVPETLNLIVTNPNLSGRAMKVMTLVRAPDGTFGVDDEWPAADVGDGQTTLIRIPLGGRIVISEAHEPAFPAVMAANPAVTGQTAKPLTAKEEERRQTLAGRATLSDDEKTELAALNARVQPTAHAAPKPSFPLADEPKPLTASEETHRAALAKQSARTKDEQDELDALQARVKK